MVNLASWRHIGTEPFTCPSRPSSLKPEHPQRALFKEAVGPFHFQKIIFLADFHKKTFKQCVTLLPLLVSFISYFRTSRKIR